MNPSGKFIFMAFLLIGSAYSQRDPFEDMQAQLNQLNQQLNQQGAPHVDLDLSKFNLNSNSNNNPFNFGNLGNQGQQGNQVPNFGSNAEALKPIMQVMMMLLRQKCMDAGKQSIANNMDRLQSDAFNCISAKVNIESLTEELGTAKRTDTIERYLGKICNIWPEVHGCINPVVSDIKQCLDRDSQRTVDLTMSIFDESNTFFCENNGSRIQQLIKEDAETCIDTAGKASGPCVQGVMRNRKPKDQNRASLFYDAEDCSDFGKVKACLVNEMNNCPSKVPAKIMGDYLSIVENKVCNSATTLSWFSAVNIFLILCCYLYSKLF